MRLWWASENGAIPGYSGLFRGYSGDTPRPVSQDGPRLFLKER